MLVYDVTSEKSFDNIRNWIRNIEEVCTVNFLVLFLGFLLCCLFRVCVCVCVCVCECRMPHLMWTR